MLRSRPFNHLYGHYIENGGHEDITRGTDHPTVRDEPNNNDVGTLVNPGARALGQPACYR